MNKLLKEAEKYTIYTTIFLLPLIFFPGFFNPFLTTKITLLVVGVSLAILFRFLRMAITGTFEFNQGPFDFPVFFLILAYLISGIYVSPNRPEAFFLPGTATAIISSALLYFLVNQLEDDSKNRVVYLFVGSSLVVSILYLMGLIGLYEAISLPSFMQTRNFSTQGALLPTSIILLTTVPYAIGLIIHAKEYVYKVLIGCAMAIISIVLVIVTFNMLTDRANFRIASTESSLSVTFDSLKNSAIFGIGPSNYISAYTRFRPLSTNRGEDWTSRYSHARNFYFTAITETGLFGALALILIAIVLIRSISAEIKSREHKRIPIVDFKTATIALLFIVLAIFPATSPEILMMMFVGLALISKTRKFKLGASALAQHASIGDSRSSKAPAAIAATPFIIGIFYLLFVGGKLVSAEQAYKRAVDSLSRNEGTVAYETLQDAINLSPTIDRYHATYSQVNFLLAEAVARKEEVSDADRNTIASLIQQAIREAKTTVALNPQRAGNWEILGNTYRSIMTLSEGADAFAIQSYGQAVLLDPINPNLRIALGGVWYAVQNYESAIDAFKLAVIAKQDHANARYNLAAAYRENGQIERAKAELQVVLTLVELGTQDYETAQKELEALENQSSTNDTSPTNGESLTAPDSSEPLLEPGIELPADAGPEISPSPSPSPTPTNTSPSPTPTPTATP